MLLGAACHLAQMRNFSGTLNLIFQPAEEIVFNGGAERMIQEDLFDRFLCDAVFSMHNHPGYPSGMLMFRDGPFMAAFDTVYITVHGKGAVMRPARKWRWILSCPPAVWTWLYRLWWRVIPIPFDAAVVTVGAFNAGQAPNAIPP